MRTRRGLLPTLALAGVLVTSACAFDGLAFVQDTRLAISAPTPRETVELPVTVTWETTEDVLPPGGAYGVYVDGRPQPPGEPLSWFAIDDDACERDPTCPDEDYYRRRDVHVTDRGSFTIEQLPTTSDDGRRERHEVTVVLLDAETRRIGESAWSIEFELEREDR